MKKFVLISGALVLAALLFGFKKVTEIKSIVEKLQTRLDRLYSINFDFSKNFISFLIDFTILNPTDTNLNFNTGTLITIKKVLFYNKKDELFGQAIVDISSIEIPANGQIGIVEVPVETTISKGLLEFYNYIKNVDNNDIKIMLELEALDQNFTTGLNAPQVCNNRVKCYGIKKNGQLRKGYLYSKGGAIVKYKK